MSTDDELTNPDGFAPTDADAPERGWLTIPPVELASSLGVPVDVESLARVIRSEGGFKATDAERIAIGWVAITESKRRLGKDILEEGDLTEAVTSGAGAGFYGHQDAGHRWISTAYGARLVDRELAVSILSGAIQNPVPGATKFLHVAAEDALHARDPDRYPEDGAAKTAEWAAQGYEPRSVPGVSPSRFLVFVYERAS